TFQNHDGEIVNGAGFADESGEGFINAVAQSRGGAPAVLLNNFDQTRLAELFALFVEAFSHAVGIDDHHVTRFDFDPAFAVITEGCNADWKTADVKWSHFARSPHQQWRVVSAVDVRQLMRARVEFAVKERDVAVRGRVVVDILIDFADDLAGRKPRPRMRPHGGVNRRHQDRRAGSLTRN